MNDSERWRLLDTGLRTPEQNAALDRALLEAREADEIPSTLRFARYTPSVLLPAFQDLDPLLDVDACRARGIAIHHRLTDGGTFFCQAPHLGWSLYLGKTDVDGLDGRGVLKRLCHAAAVAVSALGVGASYRARNEIAIDGRTLAQAGVVQSRRALLFQGLIALDGAAERAALLQAPWTAAERSSVFRDRLIDLRHALDRTPDVQALKRNLAEAYESEFAVELRDAELTLSEQARYETAQHEQAAGIARRVAPEPRVTVAYASHQHETAKLSACVVLDAGRILRHVWFTGCAVRPAAALRDLEAALRNVKADGVERAVHRYFAGHTIDCGPCKAADFIAVVRRAVDQPSLAA